MQTPYTLACLISLVQVSVAAAGPGDDARPYLQVGVVATAQPAGTPNHRVSPAISGSTVGVTAAAGAWVTRTVAVEGELVASPSVTTGQQFWYNWSEEFVGHSRDVFLGGNVRWRPDGARGLELVGGGALVASTFAERSIVRTDRFPTTRTSTQPDQVDTAMALALNGGVAFAIPAGARVEVVPAVTLRWIQRERSGLGDYLGVGRFAYQFGASVRFKLR
jgi:hypothetical protein